MKMQMGRASAPIPAVRDMISALRRAPAPKPEDAA